MHQQSKDINKGGTWQTVKPPKPNLLQRIKHWDRNNTIIPKINFYLDPLLAFALLALLATLIMEYL